MVRLGSSVKCALSATEAPLCGSFTTESTMEAKEAPLLVGGFVGNPGGGVKCAPSSAIGAPLCGSFTTESAKKAGKAPPYPLFLRALRASGVIPSSKKPARGRGGARRALFAAGTAALACACGPSAGDYPFLRPDAGYPDAAGAEAAPDAGNVIENEPLEDWDEIGAGPLTGIFAVEVVARMKVVVEVEVRQLHRMRLLSRGETVRVRAQLCRLAPPALEGIAEITVPIAAEMLLRSKAFESEGPYLSQSDPIGATFSPPPFLALLGASLADPSEGPLPTPEDLSGAFDEDRDGHPGVTLLAKTLLCEKEEELYAALRTGAGLTATIDGFDELAGAAEPRLEQSVLGYSEPCMAAAAGLAIEPLGGSTFTARRVAPAGPLDLDANGNVTCGEIVAARDTLFSAHPGN